MKAAQNRLDDSLDEIRLKAKKVQATINLLSIFCASELEAAVEEKMKYNVQRKRESVSGLTY